MAEFRYVARELSGKQVDGTVSAASEREALGALRGLLSELAAASGDAVPREEFLRLLDQALRETPGPASRARGGVACLDAANARHLDFDHVFFGGLNEGAMPQSAATNAIYNEVERVRLHGAGIELEHQGRQGEQRRSHEAPQGAEESKLVHGVLDRQRRCG